MRTHLHYLGAHGADQISRAEWASDRAGRAYCERLKPQGADAGPCTRGRGRVRAGVLAIHARCVPVIRIMHFALFAL